MEKTITKEAIDSFRISLAEEEKSRATIEKYMRDLKIFSGFLDGRRITKEIVIQYKEYLIKKYKPSSVNSMLAAINCFFKGMGWYDCVVKALKIQREAFRPMERELSKEEYFRLLRAAKEKKDIRLYLLMETICSTGIRVSELRFITAEAVESGTAVVSLKGKTRTVLMSKALIGELKRYAKRNGIKSGSIFITKNGRPMDRSNILHAMKKLCKAARVDRRKVFPHNLRHLFACLFYKAAKDICRLADLLGHSNINTTRIYTCVSGDEQARQMERLGLVLRQE